MQRRITVPSSTRSAANSVWCAVPLVIMRQGELGGKAGVARAFEGAQAMRLQFVRPPDALHRTQLDADRLGYRPASPMGRLVRRLGAGQRHHLRRDFRRDRRLAWLARLVAQQTLD